MKKIALVCSGLLFSSLANASALYFYEIGTEDTALAGAGQAARAQDASTIASNPAGMTRLPDHMVTGGLQMLGGNIDYQLNDDRLQSPGNLLDVMPNASGFYSQKINDNLYAGIGMYGNFGLGVDFGDWAGSRLIKKSSLLALTVSPSLAYKLNDRVSIGASVNANYGYFSITRDANGDHTDKDHDWAASYRLGLLMDLTDQTRAGITWNSKTNYDFNVNVKANYPQGEFAIPLTAQVNAPQQLMFSLVHDIDKQWSVMGDLGWQDWSEFGAPQITVNGQTLNNSSRLKDTWHTAVGVQYRPTDMWRLNAGVAFDSTPYHSQSDVALTMPTGDEWRFATGAQYQLTPASNIGFAVEYLHMQSGKVATPEVFSGTYDHPYLWFASMNYSYQF